MGFVEHGSCGSVGLFLDSEESVKEKVKSSAATGVDQSPIILDDY